MLRIGQVEVTAQNNKYTDGSVAGGVPATRLRAAALNALQEEVAGVVEGAGLDLDPDDFGQMLKALKLLFAEKTESLGALAALVGADNKMPYFTGTDKAALTALTAFARELLALDNAESVLTKLGLKGAAKLDVGTIAGTVAAGDDPRFAPGLGVGQTWSSVTRVLDTTYTNSTGKPIFIVIYLRSLSNLSAVEGVLTTGGVPISFSGGGVTTAGAYKSAMLCMPLPAGATYSLSSMTSGAGIAGWWELR